MKILYLVYSFNLGGTEKLLLNICNEFAKRGEEVHLMVVNDYYSSDLLNMLDKKVKICLLKRPIGKKNLLKISNEILRYVKDNEIDVVHCNSFNAPELLLKTKVVYKKVKIFYSIHSLGGYVGLNRMRVQLRNSVCDKIICISKAIRDEIVKNGADKEKTVVIYNGIDSGYFYSAKRKKWNKNQPTIGCLARIQPSVKGQDLLIDAVCQLVGKYQGLICMIAGPVAKGEEQYLQELKQIVRKKALSRNVVFLGGIANARDFLEKIDILVCPSRQEGFGLSLVEGLCAGLPCIVSNVGGLSEIVKREGVGMFFENGDSESLAKKIDYAIDSYDVLLSEIDKRRSVIAEHYSIGLMCDKLIEEYKMPRETRK